MNRIPLVSVIVAVYQADAYLHKCVDSILKQSMSDLELLLIDDGSTDSSGRICDSYANMDKRVKVYHKKNEGVSIARQLGLMNSKGKYVIYADSDDWLEQDMLETLCEEADKSHSDMVICDFYINQRGEDIYVSQCPSKLDNNNVLRELLGQKLHGATWNKLIRRECFQKYDVSFPSFINRWEDLWINCQLLLHPIAVSYVGRALYHYVQDINPSSLINNVTRSSVEAQISFCNHFYNLLDHNLYKDELYKCISSTKELMFHSNIYSSNDIKDFFDVINDRYCVENKILSYKSYLSWCVAQLLSGNEIRAYFIYKICSRYIHPLGKVIKKLIFRK